MSQNVISLIIFVVALIVLFTESVLFGIALLVLAAVVGY